VAILLETLTDNRNRTVSEVRHLLTRYGGNLGETGCVSFMFEKKGSLQFDREALADSDALLEAALDAGAEDVEEGEAVLEVLTSFVDFEAVRDALGKAGFEPSELLRQLRHLRRRARAAGLSRGSLASARCGCWGSIRALP